MKRFNAITLSGLLLISTFALPLIVSNLAQAQEEYRIEIVYPVPSGNPFLVGESANILVIGYVENRSDSSGVPEVELTVTITETGAVNSTITGEHGRFEVNISCPTEVGVYTIVVSGNQSVYSESVTFEVVSGEDDNCYFLIIVILAIVCIAGIIPKLILLCSPISIKVEDEEEPEQESPPPPEA